MEAGGIKSPGLLNELESHLREEIATLTSGGQPEQEAFQLSVSKLGNPRSVGKEFTKLGPTNLRNTKWSGVIVCLVLALGLLGRFFGAKTDLLLYAHIFSLTTGYLGAFLAGGLAIYSVFAQLSAVQSSSRQQTLERAALGCTELSAALVATGFVLGLVWSKLNLGSFLGGGLRESATLCASVWLISSWILQREATANRSWMPPLCIGGNIIVGLAWFGVGMISHYAMTRGVRGIFIVTY